jgi:glycosyltransferase involved in cell wall biosynthesis
MRILHVAESAQGGVGTYLAEILPDQARRFGVDNVRAVVPDRHAAHLSGVDRRLITVWPRPDRSAAGAARLALAVQREVARFAPTVVHAHSSIAGAVVRGLYGWRPRRFRIVYCPHGWAFDRRSSAPKKHAIELVERGLASAADRIVVISEHEQREAIRIGIAPERLSLVLNGIADQPTARPARWDDERLKLLFVGRLDEQKGFDTLIDAVEPLKDRVALRVIGKAIAGPATRRRTDRAQVEYLGWRSLAEVAAEIAAADLIAIPSRWEGFGLVALEAMREGRAVVASAVGGLREIVVDGETGRLVPPDAPERLMRAIAGHSRNEWRAMGAAGRLRFERLFTASRMNDALAQLYHELSPPSAPIPVRAAERAHA